MNTYVNEIHIHEFEISCASRMQIFSASFIVYRVAI